ncbi:MAG: hypothetical protein RBR18_06690 [Desulfovibrionaceae bacterium]|nr:hypothetical protein [Desulfovibrionaceae bacterium]
MTKATREPQYRGYVESAETEGLERFGLMSNQVWRHDPKRLVFLLSRYKFVAKMLAGKNRVLELGCADAFGSRIVRAEVGGLVCADFDPAAPVAVFAGVFRARSPLRAAGLGY